MDGYLFYICLHSYREKLENDIEVCYSLKFGYETGTTITTIHLPHTILVPEASSGVCGAHKDMLETVLYTKRVVHGLKRACRWENQA